MDALKRIDDGPTLRAYVEGDSIVLQASDWGKVHGYKSIMFYGMRRGQDGNSFWGQLTSGDPFFAADDGVVVEDVVKNKIRMILHSHWLALVSYGALPPDAPFPRNVSLMMADKRGDVR